MVRVLSEQELADWCTDIERRLAGIQGTMEILMAVRLIEDGHAPDMNVALTFVRDLDRLHKLYPHVRP